MNTEPITTPRSLATHYGITMQQLQTALKRCNMMYLSESMPLSNAKKAEYERAIREAFPPITVSIRSIAEKYSVPLNDAMSKLKEKGISLSADTTVSDHATVNKITQIIQSLKDAAEKQKELLTRDLIIFTHTALRRPATEHVLYELLKQKNEKHTRTRIVACGEALASVRKAASSHNELTSMVNFLDELQKRNMITILEGRISEENHAISSFIKEQRPETSILIIGINRGLSTFVDSYNRANRTNKNFTLIYERDVTSKGWIVNTRNQISAFEDPADKACAPFSDAPITLTGTIPVEGQNVYYRKTDANKTVTMEPLKLEKKLGSGGEAVVYTTMDGSKAAKIFHPSSNSEMKMRKLALLCEKHRLLRQMDAPIMERIAWPEKLLYNEKGEAIGYLMKAFSGTTSFAHYRYDTYETLIPGITKRHQITMAISFCELIDFCHHNHVYLCDINRNNILFDSNQSAYLIDIDSAQIADDEFYYPSNVGFVEFLSPEHIYDTTFSFRRKAADDVWIMQMLIFRMLTPDYDAYASSQELDDIRDLTKKGCYPYQSGDRAAENEMKGSIFHMTVSHFPAFLKKLFWDSLHGDGEFFHEEKRRSAWHWLRALVRYQEVYPNMVKEDSESGKFNPTRYKRYVRRPNRVDVNGGSLSELLTALQDWEGYSG